MTRTRSDRARRDEVIGGIYIETSLLDPLPVTLAHAELQRIVGLAKEVDYRVLVPRLCIDEFIEHKIRRLIEIVSKLQDSSGGSMSIHLDETGHALLEQTEISRQVRQMILNSTHNQSIGIIENCLVSQERLVELAVSGIAPFSGKGGDRGFKDAIILFTIAEHIRSTQPKGKAVILCNDGRMVEALNSLPETEGLEIAVCRSFREGIDQLEHLLTAKALRLHKRRLEELRRFLLEHGEDITGHIQRKAPFPVLMVGPMGQEVLDLDMARSLERVEILDIEAPVLGELPEAAGEGSVDISFVAKVRLIATPLTTEEGTEVKRVAEQPILVSGAASFAKKRSQLNYRYLWLGSIRSGTRT